MDTTSEKKAARAAPIRRIELSVALLATLLIVADYAVFLRHAGALWRDEINSVNLASMPTLGAMVRLAEFDSFPLLWTLALRAFMAIAGSGDAALRVAGVLGGLTVVAALWVAAGVTGRGAPVVSLAVLAAHPELLRWCATVRAFGPGAAVAVLAVVTMLRAVESPTRARILLAVAASVCSVQLLYQNAVFVALAAGGAMIAALVAGRARRAWIPIAIGAAGALSMLPYLGVIARVREWSPLLARKVDARDILDKLLKVSSDASPVALGVACVFVLAAIVGGALHLMRRPPDPVAAVDRGRAVAGAVLVVGAPMGFAGFLLALGYRTESWYYVGMMVFVAACADLALRASFRSSASRTGIVILGLIALATGAGPVWTAMHARLTVVGEIASRLEIEAHAGDLVLLHPWFYALTFDRYYHGSAEIATLPPLEDRSLHRYDLVKRRMLEEHPIAPVIERMRATLASGGRIWIVGTISSTPRGATRMVLERPPRRSTGWNAGPYFVQWSTDAADFLVAHGGTVRQAYKPPRGVAPDESPQVALVEGWRP